jgi:hypothetical protein
MVYNQLGGRCFVINYLPTLSHLSMNIMRLHRFLPTNCGAGKIPSFADKMIVPPSHADELFLQYCNLYKIKNVLQKYGISQNHIS